MDPLTQGVVGAIAAQSGSTKKQVKLAALVGFVAGGAADLDVFIQSDANPLLGLMLHRHFTHSLLFIPLGALAVATGFWLLGRWLKRPLPFKPLFLYALLGYATHGVIDAATSYGTVLGWPFTDTRFAWDLIAIIDPVFTLPLILAVFLAIRRKNPNFARAGLIYGLLYFTILAGHQYATRQVYLTEVPATAHKTARVMPALFRPFSYRGVYRCDDFIHISTISAPLFGDVSIKHAGKVRLVTVADVEIAKNISPTLVENLKNYNWFADGFMGSYSENPYILADYRYGNFGAPLNPLWGVRIDFKAQKAAPVSLREKPPIKEEVQ